MCCVLGCPGNIADARLTSADASDDDLDDLDPDVSVVLQLYPNACLKAAAEWHLACTRVLCVPVSSRHLSAHSNAQCGAAQDNSAVAMCVFGGMLPLKTHSPAPANSCCSPSAATCHVCANPLLLAADLQDLFADMSELFDDMGIDPMLFFMMSGLFGNRSAGGPFGGSMGVRVGGMGPFVFMSGGGGPRAAMYYAGNILGSDEP